MPENTAPTDQPGNRPEAHAIEGITVVADSLGKRFNREWIFRGLDYDFPAREMYAITGPNGSGKSTLLQVLWGQLPASTGAVRYHRGSVDLPADQIAAHVAIAAPYMDLIEEFTLREHLEFHFRLKEVRGGHSIGDLLDLFYLTHAADKFISNFSSGMKQRVKLGLALYTRADLMFLDEPGTNLDRQAFDWYHHHLAKARAKSTIFIASNNPDEFPEDAVRLSMKDYRKRTP